MVALGEPGQEASAPPPMQVNVTVNASPLQQDLGPKGNSEEHTHLIGRYAIVFVQLWLSHDTEPLPPSFESSSHLLRVKAGAADPGLAGEAIFPPPFG